MIIKYIYEYKQMETQANYVIQYSAHIEVVPLNGEEEENKQREGKKQQQQNEKTTNKQTSIEMKLVLIVTSLSLPLRLSHFFEE